MRKKHSWSFSTPDKVEVVPSLISDLVKIGKSVFDYLIHLDGVNQARKARGNGGNSPRLSHPVVLTGEEENGTSHLRTVV